MYVSFFLFTIKTYHGCIHIITKNTSLHFFLQKKPPEEFWWLFLLPYRNFKIVSIDKIDVELLLEVPASYFTSHG